MQDKRSTRLHFTMASLLIVNTGCLIPYIEPAADSVIRIERKPESSDRPVVMGFREATCEQIDGYARVLASGHDSDEHRHNLRWCLFPMMGCRASQEPSRQFEVHLPIGDSDDDVDRTMHCRIRFMNRSNPSESDASNPGIVYCGEADLPIRLDDDSCRIDMNRVKLQVCNDPADEIVVSGRIRARRLIHCTVPNPTRREGH